MSRNAIFAILAVTYSIAPAFADGVMKCDGGSMMEMRKQIDAAGMKKQVDMAEEEMTIAMEAMKDNKMDACAKHLTSAAKYLKVK